MYIYMTHIVNKNIINIKIHDKKKRKRRYKKRVVSTHQNAPYSNVATLITNRPQQLDVSTATNREKENVILDAINAVKRQKEILAITDKEPELNNEILVIKDKEPEKIFESPKPQPTKLKPRTITDFYSKATDNNLYNVYPEKKNVKYDRVEELGDVHKGRGRPLAKQKPNETTEQYINRIKKTQSYKSSQPDFIPPAPRSKVIDPLPRSKVVDDIKHNMEDFKKDKDISKSLKKTQALHNKYQTLFTEPVGIQTRAQKSQEEINKKIKQNLKDNLADSNLPYEKFL